MSKLSSQRNTKEALFFVLLGAKMPAILVETSFLSHADEELRLASNEYQEQVADSISEAVAGGVVAATAEAAGPVALTVARGRLLNLMIAVLCWEEVARNDGQGAGLALLLTILAFIEGPAGPAVKAADDVGAAAASGSATVTEVLAELQAGRSAGVKVVESDEALEALYARLSAGGQVVTPKSYPGQMVVLPNGMRIGLRVKSKSGGMTIDVFPVSGNPIKVHVRK